MRTLLAAIATLALLATPALAGNGPQNKADNADARVAARQADYNDAVASGVAKDIAKTGAKLADAQAKAAAAHAACGC